jgi:hypothetical protein
MRIQNSFDDLLAKEVLRAANQMFSWIEDFSEFENIANKENNHE